ncbi:MAG: hypothetical protein H6993_11005 [Pseudomonadales bacterium]|nr:hypothetical protein [Pseudomonadales bacterium]MCP5184484.1 hypothetical protein [Pseudomonadales bacterium]
MYVRPTSPLTISGVLDQGFKLYTSAFRPVLGLAILTGIASALPNAALTLLGVDAEDAESIMASLALFLPIMLIGLLLYGVFYLALVIRLHAFTQDDDPGIARCLSRASWKLIPVTLSTILFSLIVFAGLLLLLVPGMILAVYLSYYVLAITLDDRGPVDGLKYSLDLVRGYWWRCAIIATMAVIITGVAGALVGLASATVQFAGDVTLIKSVNLIVSLLVSPAINAIFIPLNVAFAITLYQDLKLRKEGDDLNARIDAITI